MKAGISVDQQIFIAYLVWEKALNKMAWGWGWGVMNPARIREDLQILK